MASVSHYSTSIKGGGVSKSLMSNGMGDRGRRAINYGSIVRDWGRCFGRDAVAVYNYGERHLGSWDIIDHFSSTFDAAISEAPRNAGIRNISLSPVHLAYLRRFNLHLNQNPSIKKGDIRARFLQLLQGVGTGRISLRPSRSAAEAFYASFAQENALLAELVPGAADFFSDDFSMYPEEAIEIDSLVEDSEFLRVLQALGLARS